MHVLLKKFAFYFTDLHSIENHELSKIRIFKIVYQSYLTEMESSNTHNQIILLVLASLYIEKPCNLICIISNVMNSFICLDPKAE